MHQVRVLIGVVFTVLCLAGVSSAQTSSLTGRVVDPQGATVAGAEVVLVSGKANEIRPLGCRRYLHVRECAGRQP